MKSRTTAALEQQNHRAYNRVTHDLGQDAQHDTSLETCHVNNSCFPLRCPVMSAATDRAVRDVSGGDSTRDAHMTKGSVREQTTRSFLLRLLVFVVVVVVVAAVSVRKRVEGGGRASSSLPDLRPAAPRF
ncbi:hypothetical protein BHM03_00047779 [Ensete ventricosum]|nr:hypothetical protein BHM03_00047779 [Ensete ventricosum]